MEIIVSQIGFRWDQARQVLWFHATLSDGTRFDVGFPLAHVAATFDSQMLGLGFCGGSLGSIPNIDGFVDELSRMGKGPNLRLRSAMQRAIGSTLHRLAAEGTHYGSYAKAAIGDPKVGRSAVFARVKATLHLGPEYPYSPTNIVGNLTPDLVAKYHLTAQQISDHQQAQLRIYDPGGEARNAANREAAKHAGVVDKTFGSGVQKALQSAGSSALKVVTAVPKAVGTTAVDIAKGQNVLKSLEKGATAVAKDTIQAARIVGNVATLIPGVGTAAAFAIQYTGSVADAVAHGKNVASSLEHAALTAALNSLPGGELTGAAIRTVANIAAAGVQGQNVLKSAAHEITGAAINLVPSDAARSVLQGAADAALSGQNVLQGAKAAAINQALNQIPDASARQAVEGILQGKPPESVLQGVGSNLLARAAAAAPTGGAAAIVTGVLGKSPAQLVNAVKSTQSGIRSPVRNTTPRASTFFQGIGAAELRRFHVR